MKLVLGSVVIISAVLLRPYRVFTHILQGCSIGGEVVKMDLATLSTKQHQLTVCIILYMYSIYGSGHETVAVLLPGFAIIW